MLSKEKKLALYRRYLYEREKLLEAGVGEGDIRELLRYDERQLYSDAKFYSNIDAYANLEELSLHAPQAPAADFMDEIENQALYKALHSLKPVERKIIVLHIIQGYSLRGIADDWDKPYSTVKSLYTRTIEKLKKYF